MANKTIVNVEVTEEDILLGKQHNCHDCPVARALNRTFGPGAVSTVKTDYITVEFPGQGYNRDFDVPTRWEIVDFMRDFDLSGPDEVSPFDFSVEVSA